MHDPLMDKKKSDIVRAYRLMQESNANTRTYARQLESIIKTLEQDVIDMYRKLDTPGAAYTKGNIRHMLSRILAKVYTRDIPILRRIGAGGA